MRINDTHTHTRADRIDANCPVELKLGDCIEHLSEMQDESIDIVVTDPPYGISYKTSYRKDKSHRFNRGIANDENIDVTCRMIKETYRLMKNDSAMFMFASPRTARFVEEALVDAGFKVKNHIVWSKNNWSAGDLKGAFGYQWELLFLAVKGRPLLRGYRFTDVWEFNKVPHQKAVHQNQKSIDLLIRAIESFSDEGDVVLDPFMGSGSTG